MAGFAGKNITSTYKDVLNLFDTVENEGLTSSAKRIFDGGGVGSPLYMSTSLLQVGTSSVSADMKVFGSISAKSIKLKKPINNEEFSVFTPNSDGSINVLVDFKTKSSVVFQADGYDNIVMDATNSSMKRGDGSKGNVKLGATDVTLQKGTTDLFTAKEDGTIQFQKITDANKPSNPSAGDLAIIDNELHIGV